MKKFAIEFKYAVIFSVASLAWFAMEKFLGWHEKDMKDYMLYSTAFSIIALVVYVIALKERKKSLGNIISWREVMIYGSVLSAMIAILSPIVQFISVRIISPDFLRNSIEVAVAKGTDRTLAETFYGFNSVALQAFVFSLSMGILTTAIVALFIRTKKEK